MSTHLGHKFARPRLLHHNKRDLKVPEFQRDLLRLLPSLPSPVHKETGRSLRERFGEHLRSIEKTCVFSLKHNGHSLHAAEVSGIKLCNCDKQPKRQMRLILSSALVSSAASTQTSVSFEARARLSILDVPGNNFIFNVHNSTDKRLDFFFFAKIREHLTFFFFNRLNRNTSILAN